MLPSGSGNSKLERENLELRRLVESLRQQVHRLKSHILSDREKNRIIIQQQHYIRTLEQRYKEGYSRRRTDLEKALRELQDVDEAWRLEDAKEDRKQYISPEDRKQIRAGVVAAGPVQAQSPNQSPTQSPKRPEKITLKRDELRISRPQKRKPSKKLNLDEPKRQEIELDKKYKVGDNVEVVLYKRKKRGTKIDKDSLKTWDATVLKVPHKKDSNFRGIPVPAGYYVVEFHGRRELVSPALGSPPSGLNPDESVYVIKGKFEEGYGSVKLEKKLGEKLEQSLRF